ncbi:hypothetical protein AVEN_161107-1 [Araneus ventricosus]|uniref:Uncharacterized protein n=1 Tax=Araneus ventricosus TaxID=182803 RepID=A0A4Y2TBU4_ARAVE|nr:hypothetical protein AVEN_161107-1 [Araneus ventricosus]
MYSAKLCIEDLVKLAYMLEDHITWLSVLPVKLICGSVINIVLGVTITGHEFSLLMSKDSDYVQTAVSNSSGEHRKLIVIEQMACHEIPLQKLSYMYGEAS